MELHTVHTLLLFHSVDTERSGHTPADLRGPDSAPLSENVPEGQQSDLQTTEPDPFGEWMFLFVNPQHELSVIAPHPLFGSVERDDICRDPHSNRSPNRESHSQESPAPPPSVPEQLPDLSLGNAEIQLVCTPHRAPHLRQSDPDLPKAQKEQNELRSPPEPCLHEFHAKTPASPPPFARYAKLRDESFDLQADLEIGQRSEVLGKFQEPE